MYSFKHFKSLINISNNYWKSNIFNNITWRQLPNLKELSGTNHHCQEDIKVSVMTRTVYLYERSTVGGKPRFRKLLKIVLHCPTSDTTKSTKNMKYRKYSVSETWTILIKIFHEISWTGKSANNLSVLNFQKWKLHFPAHWRTRALSDMLMQVLLLLMVSF